MPIDTAYMDPLQVSKWYRREVLYTGVLLTFKDTTLKAVPLNRNLFGTRLKKQP
jgi:hypothetical protein